MAVILEVVLVVVVVGGMTVVIKMILGDCGDEDCEVAVLK